VRHGIAEAWLIDKETQTVSIFLDPSDTGYRKVLTSAKTATVTLALLPNVSIPLADLGDASGHALDEACVHLLRQFAVWFPDRLLASQQISYFLTSQRLVTE
jgi:hypothetical protein